ncbi:lethal (3) 04053 [Haemaphysalis longicornis]
MAASSDDSDVASTGKDANPFSFQHFVTARSTSELGASNELGDLIASGRHTRKTHRKCLVVVDDQPQAQACMKRPQSLDLIAHRNSLPARRLSSSDASEASCSSNADAVAAAELACLRLPLTAEAGTQCPTDELMQVSIKRLEEENKHLLGQLQEALKVNNDQCRRLKRLEEELVVQQAKERDETAALERMVQQVEGSLKAALERASDAEQLSCSLKQEVKALQARCKQLEQHQHENLSEMTSDLSCKLQAAANSAEVSLRSLLEGVQQLRLYSQVVASWTKVQEDS